MCYIYITNLRIIGYNNEFLIIFLFIKLFEPPPLSGWILPKQYCLHGSNQLFGLYKNYTVKVLDLQERLLFESSSCYTSINIPDTYILLNKDDQTYTPYNALHFTRILDKHTFF